MRKRAILPADCAQACQQLSLRMDSELSDFESLLLDAHLAGCSDCRAFAEGITDLTKALRTAAIEQPSFSFEVKRSRTRTSALLAGSLRAGSAAAAVLLVALSGLATLRGSTSAVPSVHHRGNARVLELHERQLQRLDGFGQTRKLVIPRGLAAAETDGRR
jgi:predicted anti-sigma-YlaC factor YlaD